MTTYAQSGVNNDLKEKASRMLYEAAKETWKNRKGRLGEIISPFDDFSGIRAIDVSSLPKGSMMNLGFDGIGTKIELGERLGDFSTAAFDLFAMVCDDTVVRGAEPVIVGSVLDVNSLKRLDGKEGGFWFEYLNQLAKGYIAAAKSAGVAVVNGEIAELGSRVGGYGNFNSNWSACVAWFARKERMFTGREIKQGDILIGLEEKGLRSNGLSLARRVFKEKFGDEWHYQIIEDVNLGDAVNYPSTIYCKAVAEMFGGFDKKPKAEVHGVCHVTGGGVPEKLSRVLRPSGLGAVVDDAFEVPKIVHLIQEYGNVNDEEAYKTWNMGQGMIVIAPDEEEANIRKVAEKHGIRAKIIGFVEKKQEILIRSKGYYSYGNTGKFR